MKNTPRTYTVIRPPPSRNLVRIAFPRYKTIDHSVPVARSPTADSWSTAPEHGGPGQRTFSPRTASSTSTVWTGSNTRYPEVEPISSGSYTPCSCEPRSTCRLSRSLRTSVRDELRSRTFTPRLRRFGPGPGAALSRALSLRRRRGERVPHKGQLINTTARRGVLSSVHVQDVTSLRTIHG